MSPAEFQSRFRRMLERLYAATPAADWGLPLETFAAAVQASWEKHGAGCDVEEYAGSLRLRDLALAQACVLGKESAWREFLEGTQGALRSAGRSLAGSQGEELADGIFGELYERRERLASFAGRSTLAGWLRAVLYQVYVDRLRQTRREVPLQENGEGDSPLPAAAPALDTAVQAQYEAIARQALGAALRTLPPRQKLLLDFYYFRALTLREAAALVGVHEATASRELERARRRLRQALTDILKKDYHLREQEVRRCLYEAAGGELEIQGALQEPGTPAVHK
jgi:RNA polymerase sigma-70 factor (ECF subfamily)